jgi:hypothetical protein
MRSGSPSVAIATYIMSVFYLLIEAVSTEGDSGAFINCWIQTTCLSQAERTAREMIVSDGWRVSRINEAFEVNASYYASDSEGLEYFKQALVDKKVLIFNIFPRKN